MTRTNAEGLAFKLDIQVVAVPVTVDQLVRQSSKNGIDFPMPTLKNLVGAGPWWELQSRLQSHFDASPSISPQFSHLGQLGHDASVMSGVRPDQNLLIRRLWEGHFEGYIVLLRNAIPLRQTCTRFYLFSFRFWVCTYFSPSWNSGELFAVLGGYLLAPSA